MIKSIRLKNFFSFKDQKIEFNPTNFLGLRKNRFF